MSFFAELERNNVIRMAASHLLVAAWLHPQVATAVLPMFGALAADEAQAGPHGRDRSGVRTVFRRGPAPAQGFHCEGPAAT
jgi:hypothetical protein